MQGILLLSALKISRQKAFLTGVLKHTSKTLAAAPVTIKTMEPHQVPSTARRLAIHAYNPLNKPEKSSGSPEPDKKLLGSIGRMMQISQITENNHSAFTHAKESTAIQPALQSEKSILGKLFVAEDGLFPHKQTFFTHFVFGKINYYLKSDLLGPLLRYIALSENTKPEDFRVKIIFSGSKTIELLRKNYFPSLSILSGMHSSLNNYIFCAATKNDSPAALWAIILHELIHHAILALFEYEYYPFTKNESQSKNGHPAYQKIASEIKHAREIFMASKKSWKDPPSAKIWNELNGVFHNYPSKDMEKELVAQLGNIIGTLGVTLGEAWLINNVPSLVEHYQNHVIPKAIRQIEKLQATPRTSPLLTSLNGFDNAGYHFSLLTELLENKDHGKFLSQWKTSKEFVSEKHIAILARDIVFANLDRFILPALFDAVKFSAQVPVSKNSLKM